MSFAEILATDAAVLLIECHRAPAKVENASTEEGVWATIIVAMGYHPQRRRECQRPRHRVVRSADPIRLPHDPETQRALCTPASSSPLDLCRSCGFQSCDAGPGTGGLAHRPSPGDEPSFHPAEGADARAVSCNGRTPLQETAIHGATAVARLLRERGVGE
jgi:hypothetical protein